MKHWEMMRWVVRFIDENREEWERIRKMKIIDKENEQAGAELCQAKHSLS